jgi:hypothetical protein
MEMTPNSIVGMAAVKGLQAIAITDHNSIENVEACLIAGETYGVLVLPGIEVQTKEDVHVLCLFSEMKQLVTFSQSLEPYRIIIKHQPEKFGRQVVFSEVDEELGELEYSLYFSYTIGLTQLFQLVSDLEGAFIPAHVDRNSFSVLSNLGFVPFDLPIATLEYSNSCNVEAFQKNSPMLKKYAVLIDSDAHQLEDINEPIHSLEIENLSRQAIIDKLRRG